MKKLTAALLALVMALTLCTAAWAATPAADYLWYTGETTDTYIISSDAQLLAFANIVSGTGGQTAFDFAGKVVKLGTNIDLTNIANWTPIGGLDASKDFKGEFDGNGKIISNLTISLGDQGNNKIRAGLFASFVGSVHDLTISNVNISVNGTNVRAGALAANIWTDAQVDKVNVKNVTITIGGSGNTVYAGGLAGYIYSDNAEQTRKQYITNVVVDGYIFSGTGDLCVGGLAAYCYDGGASGEGKLKNIEVKNVDITAGGAVNAGGVNGYHNGYFNVENVDATNVTITVTATSESKVGGFFGGDALGGAYDYKDCDVSNISITIEGTAKVIAGGFGGYARGGECWAKPNISNCKAQGTITNNNTSVETIIGGYYGSSDGGQRGFSNVTADVDINSAIGTVGGFIGASVEPWNSCKQEYSGCQALGDVNGSVAGGFIGAGSRAIVTNCVVKGNVSGDVAGGLVGKITHTGEGDVNSIKIDNAEVKGVVTGKTTAGGLIGDATASDGKNEPVSVKNSFAAPVVIGTTSDAVVSATVAKKSTNTGVTESGNSSGTVIKGSGITVTNDPNTNKPVVNVPMGAEVNGTQITETEQIDGTNGKIIPTMTLSANTGSIKTGKTVTFTYTFTGDGTVTAKSSDSGVAIVTVDAENKTVTITGMSAGTAIITVSGKETANYDSASAEYTVEVTQTRRYTVKPNATPTAPVESPKTADAGIAIYGVMAISSVLGMGYIGKKKF